jgi:hypothetical protein
MVIHAVLDVIFAIGFLFCACETPPGPDMAISTQVTIGRNLNMDF